MEDTFFLLRQIISNTLGVFPSQITLKARFVEDLNANPLDLARLILDYQEKFNITISDEDATKLTTVGQAVEFIDTAIKNNQA